MPLKVTYAELMELKWIQGQMFLEGRSPGSRESVSTSITRSFRRSSARHLSFAVTSPVTMTLPLKDNSAQLKAKRYLV